MEGKSSSANELFVKAVRNELSIFNFILVSGLTPKRSSFRRTVDTLDTVLIARFSNHFVLHLKSRYEELLGPSRKVHYTETSS